MTTAQKKRTKKKTTKTTVSPAKLRKQLNALGKSYKALVRELAKR